MTTGRTRMQAATSVLIDGDRLRRFFWLNRTPLSHVGPMIGKSDALLSVVARKGCLNLDTADKIASAMGIDLSTFISAVASAEELERIRLAEELMGGGEDDEVDRVGNGRV